MLPISYKVCEGIDFAKERQALEEHTKDINLHLNNYLAIKDSFSIPKFQYNSAANPIPLQLHSESEFIWIDTEQALIKLVSLIKEKHRVIGIDMEYYTFDKVNCT